MSNLAASVITTFPNNAWDVYAKKMLEGFTKNFPMPIPILIFLDDDTLLNEVTKLLRPQDAVCVHANKERAAFLERNKGRDDAQDYRKQASRFCHKVFALKDAADFWKASTETNKARYVIWLDADVLITRPVTVEDVAACLPKQGDAVSYLGRKDWPHSECGWLAFDLENGGSDVIDEVIRRYTSDEVFKEDQWHDSWIFDRVRRAEDLDWVASDHGVAGEKRIGSWTNLTAEKPGMEIWPQSPMAAWSRHYKGPIAKQELSGQQQQGTMKTQGLQIQTKNSIPNEDIQRNILENQAQIKQWISTCTPTDEEIIVASAGPMLIAEDLLGETAKIVAVKHALQPLKDAGVKPWACILLDPREHVSKFVENPDKGIIWFVASQVTPSAVKTLLDAGCDVWGYHAAVGADEEKYTQSQSDAIVSGGSATATRGLFMLDKLGFRNFKLYGYDLCLPDKPDMNMKDEFGQPKHFEVSIDAKTMHYKAKRAFWSDAQLIAQYQELTEIMAKQPWKIKAIGHGILPFMTDAKRISDLRDAAKKSKLNHPKPVPYGEMLRCSHSSPKNSKSSTPWHRMLRKILLKPMTAKNS